MLRFGSVREKRFQEPLLELLNHFSRGTITDA